MLPQIRHAANSERGTGASILLVWYLIAIERLDCLHRQTSFAVASSTPFLESSQPGAHQREFGGNGLQIVAVSVDKTAEEELAEDILHSRGERALAESFVHQAKDERK